MTSSKKDKHSSKYNGKLQKKYIDEQITGWLTSVFLFFMFVIYPLYTHNRYFDITVTKYLLFKVGVVLYSILFLLAVLIKYLDTITYKSGHMQYVSDRSDAMKKHRDNIMSTDIFMLLFVISGFTAFIMSEDKRSSFTGEDGRRCGLQFLIIAFVMYICVSYGYNIKNFIMPVFSGAAICAYLTALAQYLEFNPFGMYNKMMPDEIDKFISTFGNINTFASFVCICTAIFMTLFIFEKKTVLRAFYGFNILTGGGCLIASGSDSVYMGVIFAIILLLFISIYKDSFADYLFSVIMLLSGYTVFAVIVKASGRGRSKISGISRIADHIGMLFVCLIVLTVVLVLCKLIKKRSNKKFSVRYKIIIAAAAIALLFAAVIIIGIRSRWDIFVFDDKWGTYRGFVWKRLINIYEDFPVSRKIFGNGNESVRSLMLKYYAAEMKEIRGVIYDNAHNEYLQYLVTMGIFGLASYVGLIVSAVVSGIKYASKNTVLYALSAGICAYAVQAVVNLNQSITTPYVFLLVALLTGTVRKIRCDMTK